MSPFTGGSHGVHRFTVRIVKSIRPKGKFREEPGGCFDPDKVSWPCRR